MKQHNKKITQSLLTALTVATSILVSANTYAEDSASSSSSNGSSSSSAASAASNAVIVELRKLNESTMPAVPMSINESMNNLFATPDALFPTVNASTSDELDTSNKVNQDSSDQTEHYLKEQLQTLSNQLSTAYINLSASRSEKLYDPLKNSIKRLTYDTPSFDTLYLPLYSCANSTDPQTCAKKPNKDVATRNADSLNFDAFFGTSDYSSDDQKQAENYIQYTLQTYNPTFETSSEGFFSTLNDKLIELNGNTDSSSETANGFLISHVLQNTDFQKFWIALRSYEAKRSLVLSNFNYLKAERTPQEGLGTAYGLTDTPDASAMQIDNSLLDKTINNPEWYKQMQTASPVTLQREQLLLTSLSLRIEQQNRLTNERILATMSVLTDNLLQQGKQALLQQANQLKTSIFPEGSTN